MQQRVAIARTLLRMPPVIIVDEPTVGLDPRERIRIRNLLSKLAHNKIVLISTHVVEDVAAACERVLVVSKGRLVFDGPTEDLAEQATGKVWEVKTQQGNEPIVSPTSIRTHETPSADGGTIHRILSNDHIKDAKSKDATLEDGYIWLLSQTDIST